MGKKASILYLMSIDWRWIKQRPQFIAEGLNKEYNVIVYYQRSNRFWTLQKKEKTDIKLISYINIPIINRTVNGRKINSILNCFYLKSVYNKYSPEFVYITDPEQARYLLIFKKSKVIYDCMDDYIALTYDPKLAEDKAALERILVEKADFIFYSSINLGNKLKQRYRDFINKRSVLIRNGFCRNKEEKSDNIKPTKKNCFSIAYIGTISQWFDFDILEKSLNEIENIEYHLYGPIIGVLIPQNDKIIYKGVINHADIQSAVISEDVFIMPFKVNEIVEAVDPVKLYEYIDLNKNIISVEYEEIKRFESFVHFYENEDMLVDQLKKLTNDNSIKYSAEMREDFLRNNSWEERVTTITNAIGNEYKET